MEKEYHMRLPMLGMAVIGMYPLKTKRLLVNILYKIYGFIVLGYFIYSISSQYVEMYMNLKNINLDMLEILIICLLYTTTTVKILTVMNKQMTELLEQIRTTEKIILSDDDEVLKEIFLKRVRYNDILSMFIYMIGIVTLAPFLVQPYFEHLAYGRGPNSTWVNTLPFRTWFPFDKHKYYVGAYLMHSIFGTFGASITVTTDAFLWGNMVFIISQTEILQYKLRNYRAHARLLVENNKSLSVDDADRMCVKKCAMLHKIIISFTVRLDSCMNSLMLMDFIICSIQMGVSGIRIMMVDDIGFPLIAAIEFLMAMLTQMMLFYWHANEITIESNNLSKAIWESEWYDSADDVKKMLSFMTLRAQRPLLLNIGPFYPMSTMTAISIVKAAYSYVALMKMMYD